MKKNQKTILVTAVSLSALYVLWLLIKNSQWYLSRNNGNGDGDGGGGGGGNGAGGGGGGTVASGCQYQGYTEVTSVNGVLYNNPEGNLNKCGEEVKAFQIELNTLDTGCSLVTDGAFGPSTVTCHRNVLDAMGGEWGGSVDPVINSGDNTQQSGVDSQGNMWYIDPQSGAVIYI